MLGLPLILLLMKIGVISLVIVFCTIQALLLDGFGKEYICIPKDGERLGMGKRIRFALQ